MDGPIPGRCGSKLRGKPGQYCKRYPVPGRKRCKYHNGNAARGVAHPNFKTGIYSEHLPSRLLATYQEITADTSELVNLSEQLSLLLTRQIDVLRRVDTGESGRLWTQLRGVHKEIKQAQRDRDAARVVELMGELGNLIERGHADWATWETVLDIAERMRKMSESEQKRRIAAEAMLTNEQATTLVIGLLDAVRREVDDPDTLARISDHFVRLVGQHDRERPAALTGD